ncbi:hypothetical protein BDF19DRAFT_441295 [Syncephalis fuscata]|nr:hypothetical protein BDF19DRAFT_441295 [Syncephalis fuscata]
MNTDIMRSRMPTILSKTLPFSSFYWAPPPEKQVKAVIDDLAKQVIIGVNYATKLGFYYDSSYGYNVNVIHAQDPSRRTISYSARFGFSPRFRVLVVNEDYYRIEAKNVLDRFYMKNENNLRPATLVDTHRTISNLIREILLPTPADFIWKAPAPIRDLLAEAELQNMDPEDIIPEGPLSAEEYSRFYERALNRDLEFQNRVWSTSSLKFEFLPPYVDEKTFKQQQQHQHQQFNPSSFTTMQNLPPPPPYDSSIQAREIPQSPLRP